MHSNNYEHLPTLANGNKHSAAQIILGPPTFVPDRETSFTLFKRGM
jgi:hypothetical protein